MKLYENVVIANYLYGLGVAVGTRLRLHALPARRRMRADLAACEALAMYLAGVTGILLLCGCFRLRQDC